MKHESVNTEDGAFVFPDASYEHGEIARVAETFGKENPKKFTDEFLEKAKASSLVELPEDTWSRLENTDSYDISAGDWETVEYHAVEGNPEHPRDWKKTKEEIELHRGVAAPIILRMGDTLHLVSGNTRLMVARALGVTPKVLIVDMSE